MRSLATMALVATGFLPLSRAGTSDMVGRNTALIVYGDSPPTRDLETGIIVIAARAWRGARDTGNAIQPALYQSLETHCCGLLAPVFASLFGVYESTIGKPIAAAAPDCAGLTADEQDLLSLFDDVAGQPITSGNSPEGRLPEVLAIAVQSSRVMMYLTLEHA
jgi:hypothetical protein